MLGASWGIHGNNSLHVNVQMIQILIKVKFNLKHLLMGKRIVFTNRDN